MDTSPRLTVVGPNGWPTPPHLPEDVAIDDVLATLEELTERHGEEVVLLAVDAYLARPGRIAYDDGDQ